MALTQAQQRACAGYWSMQVFVAQGLTASFSLDDIQAAAAAIDAAFDTTLNAAVSAVGGTTTIIQGLAGVIPAPFSGASAQQKTLLACHVLMKRAGII